MKSESIGLSAGGIVDRIWRLWKCQWLWAILSAGLAAAILYVSVRPVQDLRAAGYPELGQWFDAFGHFMAFLALSLLTRPALEGDPSKSTPAHRRRAVILTVVLVCTWGFWCELAQWWIPTRGVQLMDFAANMLPAPLSQWALGVILPVPTAGCGPGPERL